MLPQDSQVVANLSQRVRMVTAANNMLLKFGGGGGTRDLEPCDVAVDQSADALLVFPLCDGSSAGQEPTLAICLRDVQRVALTEGTGGLHEIQIDILGSPLRSPESSTSSIHGELLPSSDVRKATLRELCHQPNVAEGIVRRRCMSVPDATIVLLTRDVDDASFIASLIEEVLPPAELVSFVADRPPVPQGRSNWSSTSSEEADAIFALLDESRHRVSTKTRIVVL